MSVTPSSSSTQTIFFKDINITISSFLKPSQMRVFELVNKEIRNSLLHAHLPRAGYQPYAASLGYDYKSDIQVFLRVFSKQIGHLVEKKLLGKEFDKLTEFQSQTSSLGFTRQSLQAKFDPENEIGCLVQKLYDQIKLDRTKFAPYLAVNSLESCRFIKKSQSLVVRFSLIPSRVYGSIAFLKSFFGEIRYLRINFPLFGGLRWAKADKIFQSMHNMEDGELLRILHYLSQYHLGQFEKLLSYFYKERQGKLVVDPEIVETSTRLFSRAIGSNDEDDRESRDLYLSILLSYGADFKRVNALGEVMLFRACRKNFTRTALKIIELDPSQINVANFEGKTPFMVAISRQNEQLVRAFLQKGASVEGVDHTDNTLLMRAAIEKSLPIFEMIFHASSRDLTSKNRVGNTPVILAMMGGEYADHGETLKKLTLLVERGFSPSQANHFKESPLHFAAIHGIFSCCELLITKYKVPVDLPNTKGLTPLHLASKTSAAVVELLLKAGADPTKKSHHGNTPLHLAAEERPRCVAKLLKDSRVRALLEVPNNDLKTPLHIAASNGQFKIVQLLLDAGANPLNSCWKGITPYDCTVGNKRLEAIKALFNHYLKSKKP